MRNTFLAMLLAFTALVSPLAVVHSDDTAKNEAKAKAEVEAKGDKKTDDQVVAQHLQDISVTIVAKSGFSGSEGSGVIKTRKNDSGEVVNFVWTAAHVVRNLRHEKQVIDGKSGSPKTIVEFDDAMVVKALVEEGRMVGKIEFFAEVVRYNAEEDLALLRLRKKDFIRCTAQFYLDEKKGKSLIPPVGTKLLHVGSLLGQLGSNSMTEGIMSQHGRLINKVVFDQTTVTAFPGSSGGGVYLKDGRCVGLVLRGAGETFNLIAPVRRIHEWSKRAGVEWAVRDDVKMPSDDDMRKLPVEDNGVNFSYSVKSDAGKGEKGYRTVIMGDGKYFQLGTRENEFRFPTFLFFKDAVRVEDEQAEKK
jgi:hypothetical protein